MFFSKKKKPFCRAAGDDCHAREDVSTGNSWEFGGDGCTELSNVRGSDVESRQPLLSRCFPRVHFFCRSYLDSLVPWVSVQEHATPESGGHASSTPAALGRKTEEARLSVRISPRPIFS